MPTLVSNFISLVNVDVITCPEPIVNRAVVNTILEFCKKTNILVREFDLDINDAEIYPDYQDCIDFDFARYAPDLRPVRILDLWIDGIPYEPVKRNIRTAITDWDSISNTWEKCYWLIDDYLIRFFDMKASDSNLYLKLSFKPLTSATEVDDFLYEDWGEAIVAGSKANLLRMPNKEWSDLQAAMLAQLEYRRGIASANREVISNGSGLSGQVNWRSFGE